MNRTARIAILAFGLITAFVHGVLLNFQMGHLDVLFTLNGLGYAVLLVLFFANPGFVQGRRRLLHYAFIAFTAATIVAFLAMGGTGLGGKPFDPLGWVTKLDEALLIAALVWNLRSEGGS
jgi:hypothetical protein